MGKGVYALRLCVCYQNSYLTGLPSSMEGESHAILYYYYCICQNKIFDLMCVDFNIYFLHKDCNHLTLFLNTVYSLSLLPIFIIPTRITDNSATLIDNFFINEPCNFLRHTNFRPIFDFMH